MHGRTELARSVSKDRGLNILQIEKQTRLINSLLHETANLAEYLSKILGIYREFAERGIFQNKKHFHSFLTILAISKFSRAFPKIFGIYHSKFSQNIVFGVLPLFAECLSEHSNQ